MKLKEQGPVRSFSLQKICLVSLRTQKNAGDLRVRSSPITDHNNRYLESGRERQLGHDLSHYQTA